MAASSSATVFGGVRRGRSASAIRCYPRPPNARICCRVVLPETLLMPATEPAFCAASTSRPSSVTCRFWSVD